MSLKKSLRIIGILPLPLYFLANQMFSFSWEMRMSIILVAILISLIALIIRDRIGEKLKTSQYLMLSVSLVITIVIFGYFINAV